MHLCLDVENGAEYKTYRDKEWLDLTPFNPSNQLVSVGLAQHVNGAWDDTKYFCINHSSEPSYPDGKPIIQSYLDTCTLLIGHNIKHDLKWLYSCGFTYEGEVWDTQLAEYILQRGAKKPLSLAVLAEEHDLPRKKSDLIQNYMEKRESFYDIPWDVVEEYGMADVVSTCALYDLQNVRMAASPHLIPTVKMSNEFLQVLVEMEIHGVAIDQDALDAVEDAYKERHTQLDRSLHERVHQVMGDVPVNLNSPDFCSELFYSRRVVDKRRWKQLFNIGTDSRGKALRPPLLNPRQFSSVVRANTTLLKVPKVETCKVCRGVGSIDKLTLQGVPYKIPPKCAKCGGSGVLLIPTSVTAGLRLSPMSTVDTSAAGFRANKTALLKLRDTAKNDFVKSFIDDFIELSAISTYLSTFVNGINKFKHDNILHTNLNQTITSTGRLSSSSPNLQNMPRGFTFPVKKCFVSRFEDGSIIEADYSGLEFRMAGHLSGCPSVRRYVDEGTDPHTFTRDFINNFDSDLPSITRQEAKADTFKPLYGGSSGSPRQRAYYAGFLKEHHGVADWHEALKKEAIKTKMVRLPTGREYVFPYATRLPNRYVNQTTQIVNYPVQGFATGDVVPCGIIATDRLFKQRGLHSLLILTVHDSIYVDTYPGEEEEVIECLNIGMLGIDEMFQEFYGINMSFPLAIEIKEGPNAFEMQEVN